MTPVQELPVNPANARVLATAIEAVIAHQPHADVLAALMMNLTALACSHTQDPDGAAEYVRAISAQAIAYARESKRIGRRQ